jgi:hypothetical protein
VYIPNSVINISEGAFEDCPNFVARVSRNSYAHLYFVKLGIENFADVIVID